MSRSVWVGNIPLLIAVALFSETASATTALGGRPVVVRATGAQMLEIAEEYVRRGQQAQAERLLELLTRDPNPDIHNEARFRLAVMASAAGKYSKAAVILRRILDENPNAARVRLELAAVLNKTGDSEGALRQLRALRSANLPPSIARFVDRLSASLQERKPLGFHLELAIAPDTNINRATSSDTLGTIFGDFTINQKAMSGVGATARGLLQARLRISNSLQLVARATGDANIYRHSEFNDITLDVTAGPEFHLGKYRLTTEVGGTDQWFGMKPFERTVHLGASMERPLGPVSQLRLDAAARHTSNMFNDLESGRGVGARLYYERAFSPAVLFSISGGADRFKANNDAYSTTAWDLGLAAYGDVGRTTLSVGVDIGRLRADERLVLLLKPRDDKLTRVELGAVFRKLTIKGFAPTMRLVFERDRSTVAFYDYRRVRSEFGISRAF